MKLSQPAPFPIPSRYPAHGPLRWGRVLDYGGFMKNKHFRQAMAIAYAIPKRKNKAKVVHAWAKAMRKGLK